MSTTMDKDLDLIAKKMIRILEGEIWILQQRQQLG